MCLDAVPRDSMRVYRQRVPLGRRSDYIAHALKWYRADTSRYPAADDSQGRSLGFDADGISSGYVPTELRPYFTGYEKHSPDFERRLLDPFAQADVDDAEAPQVRLRYATDGEERFLLISIGPDGIPDVEKLGQIVVTEHFSDLIEIESMRNIVYDPTNGYISSGDIFLTSGDLLHECDPSLVVELVESATD